MAFRVPAHNDGRTNELADFIGVNHINIGYSFSLTDNCLCEGGLQTRLLGSKSLKIYCDAGYKTRYKPHTDWGDEVFSSPAELAKHPFYRRLFDMDLNTFFIGTYVFSGCNGSPATYFAKDFTQADEENEYRTFYDLTFYLCQTYGHTGKSFILQNWEGDWASMPRPDRNYDPPAEVYERMIRWTNVRQRAVEEARKAAGCENRCVFHALEFNLPTKGLEGRPCVVNQVVPYTSCDFYSYSCYDYATPEQVADVLDYCKDCIARSGKGKAAGFYIGELGYPENIFSPFRTLTNIRTVTEIAREKQLSHVLFWSIYDERKLKDEEYDDDNEPGYWLIKPSGKKANTWDYYYQLLHGQRDPDCISADASLPDFPLYAQAGEKDTYYGVRKKVITGSGVTVWEENDGLMYWVSGKPDPIVKNEENYLYFGTDEDVLKPDMNRLRIRVEYLDEGTDPFCLQYNAVDEIAKSMEWPRKGTGKWLVAEFEVTDAQFAKKLHNGIADFRFDDRSSKLSIRRVEVDRF